MASTLPICKNPQCPDRNRMILVEENSSVWVFACEACRDIHRVISCQVKTKPAGVYLAREEVKLQHMKRAKEVQKKLGRISYFR